MKLSSVLLTLLLAPAALVHAHGGDGGKNGNNESCVRGSTLLLSGPDRSIDSLQLAV
jgi:hypothetical protein